MANKLSITDRILAKSSNKYASRILDSTIYEIAKYHDMGNYMLNCIVSGNLFGGVPTGKIIEFSGDSSTGKSYLMINSLVFFIKQSKKNYIFLFESEGSIVKSKMETVLTEDDSDRFITFPVKFHEDLQKQTAEVIEMIEELKAEDPDLNFYYCLDSLGMLSPRKQHENMLSGKESKVMTEPQLIKAFFNMITMPFAEHDVACVYTNHIYSDFMNTSYGHIAEVDKKKTRGGQGVEYSPDVKIRLMKAKVRDQQGVDADDLHIKKSSDDAGVVTGTKVKIIPTKSRFIAEKISKVEIDIRFKIGMDRYSGLMEFLENHKLIKKSNGGAKGTKIQIPEIGFEVYASELKGKKKSDFWDQEKLEYIDRKFKEFYELQTKDEQTLDHDIEG